jgi:hypothetical protein
MIKIPWIRLNNNNNKKNEKEKKETKIKGEGGKASVWYILNGFFFFFVDGNEKTGLKKYIDIVKRQGRIGPRMIMQNQQL